MTTINGGNYSQGYIKIAKRGNTLLKTLVQDTTQNITIIETEDRYDPCDTIISGKTTYIGGEIKIRNKDYDDMMLQLDKWNDSVNSAHNSGCTDWTYWNFISADGEVKKAYCWRESLISQLITNGLPITQRYCYSDSATENNTMQWRECYMLPTSCATVFIQNENGKWTKKH